MGINSETDQGLKTDATLAELSHAEPHDERDLACVVGGFWWAISSITLLVGSLLLPGLIEHGLRWWQSLGALYGLAISVSMFTWVRRLREKTCYAALVVSTLLSVATNVALMWAAPGAVSAFALLMLAAVMYSAYFLSGTVTLATTVAVTLATILPATLHADTAGAEHIASRLTVWIPVLWLVAGSMFMQNRDRHEAVEQARRQALTDRLTRLDNLRALRAQTAEALTIAREQGRQTGLLLIDVDDLKEMNAVHGHGVGDEVLKEVADSLQLAASGNHRVSRISGDVFAVLIENAVAADLEPLATRYRAAVQSARSRVGIAGTRLDAGVGSAIAPDDGETLEALMTTADRSLYDVKRRSRDSVEELNLTLPSDLQRQAGVAPSQRELIDPGEIDPNRPVMFGRPLHAFTAAGAWLLAIVLMLLSMAMPDADRSHIELALLIFMAAFIPAAIVFLFPPSTESARHLINDMLTLAMIAVVMAVTGGIESPALGLVFVFMIHEGWFLRPRQLIPRALGMIVVVVLPLTYDEVSDGVAGLSQVATLYMAISMVIWQTVAMGFNRTYILRAQDIAHRLATLDPLTGLANRATFADALAAQLDGRRYLGDDSLAVVMLDLEGFKRINSERGHGAGDQLLCEIADALRATMRADDMLARTGGDEFAVIVPSAGEQETRILAERLVSAVDDCVAISPDASASRISTCAGFSLFPTHGRTADELMSAADLALLTVKTGGRGSRVSRLVVGL